MHTFWKVHVLRLNLYFVGSWVHMYTAVAHSFGSSYANIFHIRGGDPINNVLEIKFGKKNTSSRAFMCTHYTNRTSVPNFISEIEMHESKQIRQEECI